MMFKKTILLIAIFICCGSQESLNSNTALPQASIELNDTSTSTSSTTFAPFSTTFSQTITIPTTSTSTTVDIQIQPPETPATTGGPITTLSTTTTFPQTATTTTVPQTATTTTVPQNISRVVPPISTTTTIVSVTSTTTTTVPQTTTTTTTVPQTTTTTTTTTVPQTTTTTTVPQTTTTTTTTTTVPQTTIDVVVTVGVGGSGQSVYLLNGSQNTILNVVSGNKYRFDQSDNSNSNHPLRFSTSSEGSQYSTNVTTSGIPGNSGSYVEIEITSNTPTKLYVICTNHFGMGGNLEIIKN